MNFWFKNAFWNLENLLTDEVAENKKNAIQNRVQLKRGYNIFSKPTGFDGKLLFLHRDYVVYIYTYIFKLKNNKFISFWSLFFMLDVLR